MCAWLCFYFLSLFNVLFVSRAFPYFLFARAFNISLCCILTLIAYPGGGLPFITDGDARRNFQKQPLKVTILGVAPANFIT